MRLQTHIVSIDIGTTNLKLSLFREQELVSVREVRYQKVVADEQQYLLDAAEIWCLIKENLQKIAKEFKIEDYDIVLTSAMHTVQFLDEVFTPIGPLYTWADQTGSEGVDRKNPYLRELYSRTGTPIHSMNPYFKLKTLLPKLVSVKIGSIKDFIIYCLTGEWIIDESCASSSGLYHSQRQQWDEHALQELQIDSHNLPKVFPGNQGIPLSKEMSTFLSSHQVIVYPGYSDGVSSNGVFQDLSDTAVLSIGTSHAVRVLSNAYKVDADRMNFCYKVDNERYIIGFPSNNGGNVLEWITQQFNLSFSEVEAIVQKDLDCSGVFLPYLNGERAPIWQSNAEAQYVGITRATRFENMVFTMVCGMFFNIKNNVEALREIHPFDNIALTGGMSRSLPLCQLLADILEIPVYIAQQANLETFGSIQLLSEQDKEVDYLTLLPRTRRYQSSYSAFKKAVATYYG